MALAIPSIPLAYHDGRQEYAALAQRAGVDRVAPRALLEVAAEDVPDLLASVQMRAETAPAGCRVALLVDDRGLLRGAATVVALPAGRMLVDLTNRGAIEVLDRAGVTFADHGDDVVRIRLRGAGAAAVLEAAAGALPVGAGDVRSDLAVEGRPLLAARTRVDGFAIYCDRPHARTIWDRLVEGGAEPVGSVALETLRLEDAEPCPERDFPGPRPAAAAGLPGFGQGAVEEQLVLAEHEGDQALEAAVVRAGGEAVGSLRIGAVSPRLAGRPIAHLAVRTEVAAPGIELELEVGARRFAARVRRPVALPHGCAAPNY